MRNLCICCLVLMQPFLLRAFFPSITAPPRCVPCSAVALGGSGAVYVGVNIEFRHVPLNNSVSWRAMRACMQFINSDAFA